MRHQNRVKKLGRTAAHRKATLAALSNALIEHKRITTTLAKAKALRMFVEPIINRAKTDTTANRRQVFRRLQSKESVKILFSEVAERIGDRHGGYTRVVKLGQREGDAAEMAVIELVDYNDVAAETGGSSSGRRRTRRGGRRRTSGQAAVATPAVEAVEEVLEDVTEEATEAVADTAEVVEETTEEITEAIAEVVETVEETTEATTEEVTEAVEEAAEVAPEEVVEAVEEAPAAEEVVAEAVTEAEEVVAEAPAEVEEVVAEATEDAPADATPTEEATSSEEEE